MSAARRIKRHARRYRLQEQLREAGAEAPLVIFGAGHGDGTSSWPVMVGKTIFTVAVPPEGASDELRLVYSARATATITGVCPLCGARRHVHKAPHAARAQIAHENDCPVADVNLRALIEAERGAA